ncbi:MAG: Hsp33 family molecular chaperone HslO [Pseudanabaenaceae cyanobacterium]
MLTTDTQDYLLRAIGSRGDLRLVAVRITYALKEAQAKHQTTAIATAALGRAMSASLLLASSMKEPQGRVNLRIAGDGEIGLIFADAGQNGMVRGFVNNPQVRDRWLDSNQLDIAGVVGAKGCIRVVRDVGYGEPYSSIIELTTGDISSDVAWYLASSEQTLSKVILGEYIEQGQVQQAGGLLIQAFPRSTTNEQLMEKLERQLPSNYEFGKLLHTEQSLETIVQTLLGDVDPVVLPASKPVSLECRCTLERILAGVAMLGEVELRDMISQGEGAEVVCHFCSKAFQIDHYQLEELLTEMTRASKN